MIDFSLVILILNFVSSFKSLKLLLKTVILSGVIASLISIFAFFLWFFNSSFLPSWFYHVTKEGIKEPRIQGLFYDPNHYASFLHLPTFFCLFFIFESIKNKKFLFSLFFLISFFLLILSIFFTWSRGGIGVLFIGLFCVLIYLFFYFLNNKKTAIFLSIFLTISVLFFLFFYKDEIKNFLEFKHYRHGTIEGGVYFRLNLWKACLLGFLENPLFGVGPGNFINVYPRIAVKYNLDVKAQNYPHSSFLGTLVETGLVGFIPFILINLYILITALENYFFYSRNLNKMRFLNFIVLLVLILKIIEMIFLDSFLGRRIWFLFGIILALKKLRNNL